MRMKSTISHAKVLVVVLSASLASLTACGSSAKQASAPATSTTTAGASPTTVSDQTTVAGETTVATATTAASGSAPTTTVAGGSTTQAARGPRAGGGSGGPGGQCTPSAAVPTAAPTGATPKADTAAVTASVTAAKTFLGTLSAEQSKAVMFTYADLDAKRCSWSNFPTGIFNGRKGIRMGDLDATHRAAALAVVQSLMSATGYTYATNAIAGDQVLAAGGESNMGEDNYFLAFYGDPSSDTAWTMQFGGHHLAIHVSLGGGALSLTPYFQGLQPLSFELSGTKIEAMSVDASHMFGIFEAMDTAQLAKAKLPGSYNDLVMGPGADTKWPASEGVLYNDLTPAQQALVKSAISDWVADMAPGLSGPFVALYESQLAETKVGWSMSIDRNAGAYMRIDGPRVWIEWVNTTAGGGLHYHTIYRDKLVDYGTGSAAG
jgi:hypothetical protein